MPRARLVSRSADAGEQVSMLLEAAEAQRHRILAEANEAPSATGRRPPRGRRHRAEAERLHLEATDGRRPHGR